MKNQDRENSDSCAIPGKTCPECGGRMAVDDRRHQGEIVRIATCGSGNCDHFHWKVLDGGLSENPGSWKLADWAIQESLKVLHDEPPESGFALLRNLFKGVPLRG